MDSSCLFEQSLVLFGKKNLFNVIIPLDKIQLVTTGCRFKVPSDILIGLSRDSSCLSLPGLEVEQIDAFMNQYINKSALYNYADVSLTSYFKKMN